MKKKALSKEERHHQIILWFAVRIQNNNLSYATSHEIARGLGLTPSTKFRAWLTELVNAGRLDCYAVERPGRYPHKVYMLQEGTFTRPSRKVNLNIKGKVAGQLEMFS